MSVRTERLAPVALAGLAVITALVLTSAPTVTPVSVERKGIPVGFPGAVAVIVVRGAMTDWIVANEAAVRFRNVPAYTRASIDVSGNEVAGTTSDGLLMVSEWNRGDVLVASDVDSFVWHEDAPGLLAWSSRGRVVMMNGRGLDQVVGVEGVLRLWGDVGFVTSDPGPGLGSRVYAESGALEGELPGFVVGQLDGLPVITVGGPPAPPPGVETATVVAGGGSIPWLPEDELVRSFDLRDGAIAMVSSEGSIRAPRRLLIGLDGDFFDAGVVPTSRARPIWAGLHIVIAAHDGDGHEDVAVIDSVTREVSWLGVDADTVLDVAVTG